MNYSTPPVWLDQLIKHDLPSRDEHGRISPGTYGRLAAACAGLPAWTPKPCYCVGDDETISIGWDVNNGVHIEIQFGNDPAVDFISVVGEYTDKQVPCSGPLEGLEWLADIMAFVPQREEPMTPIAGEPWAIDVHSVARVIATYLTGPIPCVAGSDHSYAPLMLWVDTVGHDPAASRVTGWADVVPVRWMEITVRLIDTPPGNVDIHPGRPPGWMETATT